VVHPLLAIILGPFLSGAVVYLLNWHVVFIIMCCLAVGVLLMVVLFLPETLDTTKERHFVNPLGPLLVLGSSLELFMVIISVSIVTAFIYMIYLFIAIGMPELYHLDAFYVGCCYLPIGVSYIIGGLVGK
jgi:MFS transporter, DHA1 family, multidrug resistance protein